MAGLMYKNTDALKIGDVHRFVITYTPSDIIQEIGSALYIRVKNIENFLLNSVLLTAPYLIYCDIRTQDYSHKKECFVTDDQPVYDPNLIPGQSLTHKLSLHKLQDKYVWIVDVISQIIFSSSAEVNFELLLTRDADSLNASHSAIKDGNYSMHNLAVEHLTTTDLWNKPPKSLTDPIHLIILTHGLHSNVSADMFYIKEQIEKMGDSTGENIVIRGYRGNVCKTERGIRYLGRRLAEFIVNESMNDLNQDNVKKISFIGHSLGGPVQTFAISYINYNYPNFFERFSPENFIAMASPLLGISNENPSYVKVFLKFGIVGKTGQDLNLDGTQPMLLLLPSETTRKVLKKFKRRTVYANALNDGIVPLRTSALLYLDYKALTSVYHTLHSNPPNKSETSTSDGKVSEIPVDIDNEISPNQKGMVPVTTTVLSSIKSKIQSTIGLCLPNLQAPTTTQKYNYFQTTTVDDTQQDNQEGGPTDVDIIKERLPAIPKSSVLTSITKIILPPQPTVKYINDPKSRYNPILHDQIYTPNMIPKKITKLSKNIVISQLEHNKRHRYFEEKIARRWHQGMSWRKVLVYLQPDAHNNMIVRRRFANAYGWQVVDHMVENHFGEDSFKGKDIEKWEIKNNDDIMIDLDKSELDELNRRFGEVMNKEFIKENKGKKNHSLRSDSSSLNVNQEMSKVDNIGNTNKSISQPKEKLEEEDSADDLSSDDGNCDWLDGQTNSFYDGPTGMLNTVNESMNTWKNSLMIPKTDPEALIEPNDYADLEQTGNPTRFL